MMQLHTIWSCCSMFRRYFMAINLTSEVSEPGESDIDAPFEAVRHDMVIDDGTDTVDATQQRDNFQHQVQQRGLQDVAGETLGEMLQLRQTTANAMTDENNDPDIAEQSLAAEVDPAADLEAAFDVFEGAASGSGLKRKATTPPVGAPVAKRNGGCSAGSAAQSVAPSRSCAPSTPQPARRTLQTSPVEKCSGGRDAKPPGTASSADGSGCKKGQSNGGGRSNKPGKDKLGAIMANIRQEWQDLQDKYTAGTVEVAGLSKVVTNWGKKKGTLIAQRRADLADDVVDLIKKARKIESVVNLFAAASAPNPHEALSAYAQFSQSLTEAESMLGGTDSTPIAYMRMRSKARV